MSNRIFDLSGKTALATGSSSGIGFAIASGLSAAGARVVLHGRDAERLETAISELAAAGGRPNGVRFDVTDAGAVEAGVAEAESKAGQIDILVNNAGIQRRGPLLDFDVVAWNQILATNLTSAFLVGRGWRKACRRAVAAR